MSRKSAHVPQRLCAGCSSRDARANMDRFTIVDGRPAWDTAKRHSGRGAYLHRRADCREQFLKRKPFLRSLGAGVGRAERTRLLEEPAAAGS